MQFGKKLFKKIEEPINNTLKKGVVAAVMFSGLTDADAVENKTADSKTVNTEIESEINTTKNENAYVVSPNDFIKANEKFKSEVGYTEDKIEFQAISRFEVDSHIILDKAKDAIILDFQELLNKITPENYSQILNEGINILAYSDPRKTNKYKDNEELSLKRAGAMKEILTQYLKSDAYFSNLTPKQNEDIRNIEFHFEIPESKIVKNAQKGVMNPEDKGISTEGISEADLIKIYDEYCRGVIVSIELEKKEIETIKPVTPKINLNPGEKLSPIINWEGQAFYIFVDNSPSIGRGSYETIFKKITKDVDFKDKDIYFSFFSDKLDKVKKLKIDEVIEEVKINKYNGHSIEKAWSSVLTAIGEIKNDKIIKNIKIFTDEGLQFVTLSMLNNMEEAAVAKNLNVYFNYVDSKKDLRDITLKELRPLIEKRLIDGMRYKIKDYIYVKSQSIEHILKNSSLSSFQDKATQEQKYIIYLEKALENNLLNEIIENPLLERIYSFKPYNNMKEYLNNHFIGQVDLENAGKKIDL
jgi:hypothetical protein